MSLPSSSPSSKPPVLPPPVPGGRMGRKLKRTWGLSILLLLLLVVLPVWLLMTVVPVGIGSRVFVTPAKGMDPEVKPGDWVYVNLRAYRGDTLPARGEIVVFWTGDVRAIETREGTAGYFVMRVVGLPGETISITEDGKLLVNGVPAPELAGHTYVAFDIPVENIHGPGDTFTVPPGEVYVLGDNTKQSYDSRFWGTVPAKALRGRAESCVWPLDRARWY